MSPIPARFARYVGIPYADKGRGPLAYDCWGGVRMVYAEEFGIRLPDYSDTYPTSDDHASVAAAIAAGLADGWRKINDPRCGDLLSLRIAGRPWHCALMVTPERFLHWPPISRDGTQTYSCIGRMDDPRWKNRIEGVYRRSEALDV